MTKTPMLRCVNCDQETDWEVGNPEGATGVECPECLSRYIAPIPGDAVRNLPSDLEPERPGK